MSYAVRMQSGESFQAGAGVSLLSAALKSGVSLASDCRLGGCGTCRVRVLAGKVRYEEPPMALSPEEEAAGFALACQAQAASDLLIRAESAVLPAPRSHVARVARIAPLSTDVIGLQLELEQPADYVPGQYLKVRLGDGATRNFSMAGRPDGCVLELHVRRIPGGRFTDGKLGTLRTGEPLEVELPRGSFIFRRQDYRPVVMAVTGTGLAPIRSMLQGLLDDPDCPPIILYRGARRAADLYLQEELEAWRARLNGFSCVPVLSRPDPGWRGRTGYVQDAICEDFADLSGHAIYLCGSPRMTAAARKAMEARGASMEFVYAEGFVFQREEELT